MLTESTEHSPDVLEVIADLSNTQVFTPPRFANAMLDLLPDEVWNDPTLRWLDPGCKTGVFLREVTKRLLVGLEEVIPNRQARLEHILREQMFGAATEQLTAWMSRRSLYCSKDATDNHIPVRMEGPDGNIWFGRVEHTYDRNGRCRECGASREQVEREGRDNHAYGFIHESGREAIAEEFDMQFDVVLGNPPFQMSDGGHNASATPLYHLFVETAIDLGARYVLMVTPSRWFAGGKGLDGYRQRMLTGRNLRYLVDYPKLYDGFPSVKIRGGVSYFLWDRDYTGPCRVQTMWDGEPLGEPVERYLDAFDVLVRRNEAVSIVEKVRTFRTAKGVSEPTLDQRVSSRKPFGYPTDFHGVASPKKLDEPVTLHGSQRISYVERGNIPQNSEWVDEWKVLMTRVQGTSAAVETKFLSNPIIAGPGAACTETYVVAGRFTTEKQARRFAEYLRTRFVRFLVSLRKSTQDAARGVYAFVPDVPLDREWTDADLYARYGITADEQKYIESIVAEMPT